MEETLEPRKIWVNKTFQVKQYEPVQLFNEMVLIPTKEGTFMNEEGVILDSIEDAYLMMLLTIHNVWDRYRAMLKERRKNAEQVDTK